MSFTTNIELMQEAQKYALPLIGIYNKDELPKVPQQGFYIVNLQDARDEYGNDLSGTHWTVIYIEGKKAIYMDTFGFPPPLEVQLLLKAYVPYLHNQQQIQNPKSGYCGVYVLYFMYYMTINRPIIPHLNCRFNCFLRLWSFRVEDNLSRLKTFIRGKFPYV